MMKLQSTLRAVAGLAALVAAGAAAAHPGHGLSAPDSLLHALEAEHVVGLLAVLAVGYGVVLVRAIRRRRADRAERGADHRND
jgi:membrane protease YdiL (CAAX protease family)